MKLSCLFYLALMALPILALPLSSPPSHPEEPPAAPAAQKNPTVTNPANSPNPSHINWPDGGVILMGTLATPGDPVIGQPGENSTMPIHPNSNSTVLDEHKKNGTHPADSTDRGITPGGDSSHPDAGTPGSLPPPAGSHPVDDPPASAPTSLSSDKSLEPQTPVVPGGNPVVPANPTLPNAPPTSEPPTSPNTGLPPTQNSNPATPLEPPTSNSEPPSTPGPNPGPATAPVPPSTPNTAPGSYPQTNPVSNPVPAVNSPPANIPVQEPHTQPQAPMQAPPQAVLPQTEEQPTPYEPSRPPVRGHIVVRKSDNVLAEPGDVLTEP